MAAIFQTFLFAIALTPAPRETTRWIFAKEHRFLVRSNDCGEIRSVISSQQTDFVFFCSRGKLRGISKEKNQIVATVASPEGVSFLGGHVSTNGKQIDVICSDGRVRRFSAATLDPIDSAQFSSKNSYDAISYSGAGSQVIAYSRNDKNIEVYAKDGLKHIKSVASPLQKNSVCCLSTRYDRIFVGGMVEIPKDMNVLEVRGMLSVIDIRNPKNVDTNRVKEGYVRSIASSVDEKLVAVGNSSGKIYIHDAKEGAKPTVLGLQGDPVSMLCFSNDSRFLFVGSYSLGWTTLKSTQIQIWDLAKKEMVSDHKIGKEMALSAWFDPARQVLYFGTRDGGCGAVELKSSDEGK